jgi:hypothetical protein
MLFCDFGPALAAEVFSPRKIDAAILNFLPARKLSHSKKK